MPTLIESGYPGFIGGSWMGVLGPAGLPKDVANWLTEDAGKDFTFIHPEVLDEKCIVEGVFDVKTLDIHAFFEENALDYEDSCLIRREISPAGKSRAFVNDSPVTLDILKSLGVFLMDIHSQHDTYQLGSNAFQLS